MCVTNRFPLCFFFFLNRPATTEIYTLSLHDALPICSDLPQPPGQAARVQECRIARFLHQIGSTRLNSSHMSISYAVFCLKKKTRNRARRTSSNHNPL